MVTWNCTGIGNASFKKCSVVSPAAADKYRRLTHRLSQEQKGLDEKALMVSQRLSDP
jgi:hypothetical protein